MIEIAAQISRLFHFLVPAAGVDIFTTDSQRIRENEGFYEGPNAEKSSVTAML